MKSLLAFMAASVVAVLLSACGHEAPKQPEVKAQVTVPAQAPAKAPADEAKPATEGQATGATTQE